MAQESEANPAPLPELQLGPIPKLRLAMDVHEDMMGYPVPLTDFSRPFLVTDLKVCEALTLLAATRIGTYIRGRMVSLQCGRHSSVGQHRLLCWKLTPRPWEVQQ